MMRIVYAYLAFYVTVLLILRTCVGQKTTNPIHGTLRRPFADDASALTIAAYSRQGQLIDSAPVTADASFTLHHLSTHPGEHVLHVLGATQEEYDQILVGVSKEGLVFAETREDWMLIPNLDAVEESKGSLEVTFAPKRKARYRQEKRPWKLKDLWAYRVRILQLVAVAFVVWFPQFMRELPKELREELTGEKEEDLGDPNAVAKALSGHGGSENGVGTSPVTSAQR